MSKPGNVGRLRVHQIASTIGRAHPQESVVVENTPSFRGMIKKVLHLVSVEEEKS
jgi:large subunit ribosomal protein L30